MSPSESGAVRRRCRAARAEVGRGVRALVCPRCGSRLKFHRRSQYARARAERSSASPGDRGAGVALIDYMPPCRAALQQPRFHYAWVVAAVTFLVLVMAAGFRSVPSVLFVPLGKDFGWSHALIGGAVSVNLLVYGLGAPFAAAIVERFGVRQV